ncbi:MAG: hypothetical protein SFU25_03600 [Candidatus Caenarcaniphilales bacterium]|nr:hypothetical protein [Candidatus Caenarcaniphilales bacterium]
MSQNLNQLASCIIKATFLEDQKVFREVEILANSSLEDLAGIIIEAYGFTMDHSYSFYDNLSNPSESKEVYVLDTLDDVELPFIKHVSEVSVGEVFVLGKKLLFIFDYGEDWEFEIEFLSKIENPESDRLPKVVKSVGDSPKQYADYDEGTGD